MADINVQQIEEKLNQRFPDYGRRKIIFWFDPKQDFLEEIDSLVIQNAKIYHLENDAQFKAKRLLEFEDTESNYLVYAPFTRWDDKDEDSHLLSVLKYSEEFSANRLAIVMSELAIPLKFQQTVEKYSSFFNAKDRIKSLGEFSTTMTINRSETLELMMMAVLLKSKSIRLNDLLREVLKNFTEGNPNPLTELDKFHLTTSFWTLIQSKYGYSDRQPTLEKLTICLFLNYFYYQIDQEMAQKYKAFEVIHLRTNIITFMDQYMNDTRYIESFNQLSEKVYKAIDGNELLDSVKIDHLIEADVFSEIHKKILAFYAERLTASDTTTKIAGQSIFDYLKQREKMHFASDYNHEYQLLKHAYYLVDVNRFSLPMNTDNLLAQYEREMYWVDTHYRKFIWNSDRIEESQNYEQLRRLVEANYAKFLDQTGQIWNQSFDFEDRPSIRNFYNKVVTNRSTKTVVVISDAFRYELGMNLDRKFAREKKYTTKMQSFLSVLPSVTEFGKAALLPNHQLTYTDKTEVLVDGKKTNGLTNRRAILQQRDANAAALNYDDVVKMTKSEIREALNRKSIVYIYHDQVDRTGDHGNESQVFDASESAINEIFRLISRLHNDVSIYRFIVTADHGFLYRRSVMSEAEKIENPSQNEQDRVERRFIISDKEYDVVGTKTFSLGESLGNDDTRKICVPITSSIFKKAGGGQNYVHGGSSVQEMLVPVLEITAAKGSSAKEPVAIELMTSNRRITGLSTTLEFYQKNAVNDIFDAASFGLYFEDEYGERISNEEIYLAASKEEDANLRFNKFVFEFVNQRYLVEDAYYLVIKNQKTNVAERIKFVIDNPFAQSFDFDI
ncbi:BREX-1 system phosphatase PglZ type A [Enterococcus innesii]|uniref:BREX-1 system phosphatase PglZ type A n=1 Tax=Enterococcus innesii TaxID=2839759 RepID=UPI002DB6D79B|nr:BREX-1 system phosphatase PglZ type A [Enterococcus innesii]MEB5918192.1 BREX-1 system phosphatase PglZ type A [Enterococcus innesii]